MCNEYLLCAQQTKQQPQNTIRIQKLWMPQNRSRVWKQRDAMAKEGMQYYEAINYEKWSRRFPRQENIQNFKVTKLLKLKSHTLCRNDFQELRWGKSKLFPPHSDLSRQMGLPSWSGHQNGSLLERDTLLSLVLSQWAQVAATERGQAA